MAHADPRPQTPGPREIGLETQSSETIPETIMETCGFDCKTGYARVTSRCIIIDILDTAGMGGCADAGRDARAGAGAAAVPPGTPGCVSL